MDQRERREYLIRALLAEDERFRGETIPGDEASHRRLLRSLFNVRMPRKTPPDFLAVQDAYLREEIRQKGVTDLRSLTPAEPGIYLWQGDITTLRCDAIVNAANARMLGCFQPCHTCIDNCIHTFAGVQLRESCAALMRRQGHEEPTGAAKITPAFNLPSKYVLHTVGPIVSGSLTKKHCDQLSSCYTACLDLAAEKACESVAFCCISTGVFGFPKREAASVAVQTVRLWQKTHPRKIEVIFNVFGNEDLKIYRALLG